MVDVPEECGTERELRSELARLLGREATADALPRRLQIERAADGWYELALELRSEHRSLRDPDCRALFKTAVVVSAVAIDPAVEARVEPPAKPISPTHTATAAPAAEPVAADEDDGGEHDDEDDDEAGDETAAGAGASVPWRAGAALGAGAAIALLPQVSPLLELSGTLARDRVGVALCARYLTGAEERASDLYGVRVYGFGARLAALFDPAAAVRLELGVALDRLSGRGLGSAVEDISGSGFAFALAAEASVIPLRIGHARLSLGVAGQYALVRPSFEITGHGEVYRPPRFGATGMARLGWEFR